MDFVGEVGNLPVNPESVESTLMKKIIAALAGISLITAPAVAQVRPNECVPVFPLVDDVAAAALPQDVIAEPFVPAAARRAFFGLPLLLPLLAAVGGIAAVATGDDDDDDDDNVSPA